MDGEGVVTDEERVQALIASLAEPVVVPGFVFDLVASGSTLLWFDAPGAGCNWADAIAVAPNNAATTRAEMASLKRMAISSLGL